MITVDNSDIIEQHSTFMDVYSSGSGAALFGLDYLEAILPKLEARADAEKLKFLQKRDRSVTSVYPYTIKIPKGANDLANGDFEPARVITIDKPFKGPRDLDIWFGSTIEGINLRWGYVNGDSRKIVNDALNDDTVHGFLAGATGQGKSVTVNSVIYGCCVEYPPWELQMTLSDAKIVEFKSIALNRPMPHIDIIAATADTDYLLSMLQQKEQEMILRQQIFTKAGEVFKHEVKNIKQFREVTGLCMPRMLMLFDECTAMFQMAGKRASKIAYYLDNIGRLGRNAGVHLMLDSQEVSSDLPDKTLANMRLRAAMGCTGPISTKVIGNEAAVSNLGKKGRMIVNSHSSDQDSLSHNVLVRVPYYPDDQLQELGETVIALGKKTKTARQLQFYDEQEKLYADKYLSFINSFEKRGNRILLGPPSFIMEGDEQVVSIPLTTANVDNICVFANSKSTKMRTVEMLKIALRSTGNCAHLVLTVDPLFSDEGNLEELAASVNLQERSFEQSKWFEIVRSLIYRRALCIKTDKEVFGNTIGSGEVHPQFYQCFERESEYDTEINRRRFNYYMAYLETDPEMIAGFKLGNDAKSAERRVNLAKHCIDLCRGSGCADTPFEVEKIQKAWCWVFGIERFIGIGRDSKTRYVEEFKKLLQDSTQNNVRFILFTSSFEDLAQLQSGIGYFLADDISMKQASNIKMAEDYPENLASGLMVVCSTLEQGDGRVKKFKKLMLKGEY